MKPCPCCSTGLLRHARHSGIYWFCPTCRQEMPLLSGSRRHPLSTSHYGSAASSSELAFTA
ncbi:hypothetical protein [Geitlerinema sp. PCC 9228]|jgi:hypothetical protein|uniref:hypothetical protein n=1 Tax=Geitlerinema sp. PCC 9228 TaxID=111611 RepID=UPI0009FF133C|nr:hypothetical protein [Geitlerinema sp. PCC 9228]